MRVAIVVASTLEYEGKRENQSGQVLATLLKQAGLDLKFMKVLPEQRVVLAEVMKKLSDHHLVDLIVTIGGTGCRREDCTPEATRDVIERELPGIPEAMRAYRMRETNAAMLSREVAGIRKDTLIVNLPDDPKQVEALVSWMLPEWVEGVAMLTE